MGDRAIQNLVKFALEPEWEAKFEPNSYGFRPGRSTHDAIGAIFNHLKSKDKWVLDADIKQCFDLINHDALMRKVNSFPTINRQLKAWLKSGVFENGLFTDTEFGTPQGGVISPLLANIALHGMENFLIKEIPPIKENSRSSPVLIRYADDFVIMHSDYKVVDRSYKLIDLWLEDMGLELNRKKTSITHSLKTPIPPTPDDGLGLRPKFSNKSGFNFLGFHIRQYEKSDNKSARGRHGNILGFKTIIKPSKEAIKEHYRELCDVIDQHKASTQEVLIHRLNPIILGWANYYKGVVSKHEFHKLDWILHRKLREWAKNRHPKMTVGKIIDLYWHTVGTNNWCFSVWKNGELHLSLIQHSKIKIERHVKVRGTESRFNGNDIYWCQRRQKSPIVKPRMQNLLKKQYGKCAHCKKLFKEGDVMEIDHIKPKSLGGKDVLYNLQLLHRDCHDIKTAKDGSYKAKTKATLVNPPIKRPKQ